MLLEIAIGDAYGAGFEFVKKETIEKEHDLTKYYDSRIDNIKAGQYTDDTQMTLAIIEMLLSDEEWTKENITKHFLNAFNRDKRQGYAKGFYHFLNSVENEIEFLEKIKPESNRNGAAMRSVPLGVIKSIEDLLEKCKIQSQITHNTKEGILSSQAVALMTHYFLYQNGKKDNLTNYINETLQTNYQDNKTTRTECNAKDTIEAILTVIKNSNSYFEILDKSIKLGGDTDSVASIALGVVSFSKEFDKKLPNFLLEELENDTYGREYMENLNNNLMKKFKI